MQVNFFGPDQVYHEARGRFVKGNPPPLVSRTPSREEVEAAPWALSQGAAWAGACVAAVP
jgi:hypothetical protein